MPALADLFPWQQPGCKYGRTWPIATTKDTLEERWRHFVAAPLEEKSSLFVTAKTGRNTTTKVPGYAVLNTLTTGAAPEPIVRYGYRSFDRQWAISDPRLAALERPALWDSRSDSQLYFAAPMTKGSSKGPILTVSQHVPDLHTFRGRLEAKTSCRCTATLK